MDYTKVSFKIAPNTQENRDITSALLSQLEYDTFEETEIGLDAFIKKEFFKQDDINPITEILTKSFEISFETEEIKHENWNEVWESNFSPIFINEGCVIRADFHKIDPKPEIDIVINPEMAFGTGHHQTTFLAAQELFEMKLKNQSVLDMGCGTGILSIIASILGAKEIIAIDNDIDAVNSAKKNFKLNKIKNTKTILGDARQLKNYKDFDLIIANINRNILLNDLNKYASVLSKKGKIILSGFYQKDLSLLIEEAKKHSLSLDKFTINEEWTMAVLKQNVK